MAERVSLVPVAANPLFGRASELKSILDVLDGGERWVTLTGPGGVGKTRLALEVGRALGTQHSVCFCDLASARSEEDLLVAIEHAVGASRGVGASLDALAADATARLLAIPRPLLVCDNVEQVIRPFAGRIGTLLQNVPSLVIVVTSREPAAVRGEVVIRIEPMSCSAGAEGELSEAGAFFADRVERVSRLPWAQVHQLDHEEWNVLARLFDGLPLAMEAAAFALSELGVEAFREGTQERLRLIDDSASPMTGPGRSVRASLAWSWSHLTDAERATMTALATFETAFDLEGASAVLAIERRDLPSVLRTLMRKSLLHTSERGENYRMLQLVREFVREKAGHDAAYLAAQRRHLAYLSSRTRALANQDNLAARWVRFGGDVRAALEFGVSPQAPKESLIEAAELLVAAHRGAVQGGGSHELVGFATRILDAGRAAGISTLLAADVVCTRALSRLKDERERFAKQDYALAKSVLGLADVDETTAQRGQEWSAAGWVRFARVAFAAWDLPGGLAALNRAFASTKDDPSNPDRWSALNGLGVVRANMGDFAGAEDAWRECASLAGRRANASMSFAARVNLAQAAARSGRADVTAARQLVAEALAEDVPHWIALAWSVLGFTSLVVGDYGTAVEAFDATAKLCDRVDVDMQFRPWQLLALIGAGDLRGARKVAALPVTVRSGSDEDVAQHVAAAMLHHAEGQTSVAMAELDALVARGLSADLSRVVAATRVLLGASDSAAFAAAASSLDGDRSLSATFVAACLTRRLAELSARVLEVRGRMLTLPTGVTVDFAPHATLFRVLEQLLRAHAQRPGEFIEGAVVAQGAWEGDRARPASLALRVRVSIARMRKLGLEEVIQSQRAGYRIDPALTVVREA